MKTKHLLTSVYQHHNSMVEYKHHITSANSIHIRYRWIQMDTDTSEVK